MSALAMDCCDRPHTALVDFDTARRTALAMVEPSTRLETVPLARARGRILAQSIHAPHALPPFDQAAMDGYALRVGDGLLRRSLPVLGATEAGDRPARLAQGAAHRVTTGCALPEGADTVVMLEDVRLNGDRILLDGIAPGSHIRRRGEDIAAGAVVATAGTLLGWPQIALLAAFGISQVTVMAPIRIAVVTTGSELRGPGEPIGAGAIHDSNGPMLAALLGGPQTVVDMATIADDRDAIARCLAHLAETADLVVTTAGMSIGARDHVRDAVLDAGGQLDLVKVAMKPGKPLALGRIGTAIFIGLPGNPQAAACGALAFLRPMIGALSGRPPAASLFATANFARGARADRRTALVPVRLRQRQGRWIAEQAGPEGSHRLAPLAAADAVAILPPAGREGIGSLVEILPFEPCDFGEG